MPFPTIKRYLKDVWEDFNPPNEEKELLRKVVAFIFYDIKQKPHLFVGKIIWRFMVDDKGPVTDIEIVSFKKAATSTSTILEETPDHQELCKIHNMISAPLEAKIMSGPTGRGSGKWNIPTYPLVVKTFQMVKDLKRQEEYERLFPITTSK